MTNRREMRYPPPAMEYAAIRDSVRGCWLHFRRPVDVVSTHHLGRVRSTLERVEREVNERGLHAVGFLCYEAAPAFDAVLRVRKPIPGLPLILFGLFRTVEVTARPPAISTSSHHVGDWRPSFGRTSYLEAMASIKEHIARGDTYQVNHSFRLRADFRGDPGSLFLAMQEAQQARCGAYLDTGNHAVCSASPELFFHLDNDLIGCRPMKGTSPRGHNKIVDDDRMAALRASEKNRAENAMIVDMVRNDVGRIAEVGSVRVVAHREIERYPTVLQMTSTVEARTSESLSRIMGALFPSASITGAPKVRTMAIIAELESDPRGLYTGAIGYLAPGRRAHFNVAIRTAVVERAGGTAEYGVGGGIVWDSDADDEYRECLVKARILTEPPPVFDLLETILWEPDTGYYLLERHLERLRRAAEHFVRPLDMTGVRAELATAAAGLPAERHRVRLLVSPAGDVATEAAAVHPDTESTPPRLGLASEPVSSIDPFLYFKTSHRGVYDHALESRRDCDDVVLWNERGEITESTVANIIVEIDGVRATPPTSCGLLDGTYRAELLDRGEIQERIIEVDELRTAEAVYLINSVRRRIEVTWVSET